MAEFLKERALALEIRMGDGNLFQYRNNHVILGANCALIDTLIPYMLGK